MQRRMPSGRTARLPVEVGAEVVIGVGLVSAGAAVALPRHAPGHADLLYWLAAAAGGALFVGCLLVHGLAQAAVLRRRGTRVDEMRLGPFGAVARAEGEPLTAATELRLAGAGLVSLGGLAAGFWALAGLSAAAGLPDVAVWACGSLARLGALLAVVQVLPVPPLDGGRVVRALLWRRHGNRYAAVTAAAAAGRLTSWIVVAAGAVVTAVGALAEGALTVVTGVMLLAEHRRGDDRGPTTVADVMRDTVVVPGWLTVAAFLEDFGHLRSASPLAVQRFSGEIDGVVSWKRLVGVPEGRRSSLRLSDLVRPMDEVVTASPTQTLSDLVDRLGGRPERPVVVLDHGRLVGTVALSDVSAGCLRDTRPAGSRSSRSWPGTKVE